MRPLALLALLLPGTALADAEEASIDVELGPTLVRAGAATGDLHGTAPGARLGVHATYGLYDTLALEAALGATTGTEVTYEGFRTDTGLVGTAHNRHSTVRATLGATFRFGTVYIPTLSITAGYQHRFIAAGAVTNDTGSDVATAAGGAANDLLLGGGVGFDVRLDRHWIVGVSVQAVHAFSDGGAFDAIEVPLRLAYSWYPRWTTYDFNEADEP